MTNVIAETVLSLSERSELVELEQVIEQNVAEVGAALRRIRDARLYRQDYGTFEVYCRARWGISRSYAHRQIEAAGVIAVLPTGNIQPNERQARELAPLSDEPARMQEAWTEVVANGTPTAERVREAVQSRTGKMAVHYSSETPEWETPQALFDHLHAEFQFNVDVCATPENAKCQTFFDPNANGLEQPWLGVCWMNPPYGDEIAKWVEKAWQTGRAGSVVVCLVPARVDTGWFWNFCRHGEIRLLRGRLKFGGADASAPFPSAVVIFGPNVEARVVFWEWHD